MLAVGAKAEPALAPPQGRRPLRPPPLVLPCRRTRQSDGLNGTGEPLLPAAIGTPPWGQRYPRTSRMLLPSNAAAHLLNDPVADLLPPFSLPLFRPTTVKQNAQTDQ